MRRRKIEPFRASMKTVSGRALKGGERMSTLISNDLSLPGGYGMPFPSDASRDASSASVSRPAAEALPLATQAFDTPVAAAAARGSSGESGVGADPRAGDKTQDKKGQEALKKLADDLGKALSGPARELKISIDPALRLAVFRIVDSESGDVVLQVPSEVAMRIKQTLAEAEKEGTSPAGALLQGKA